jgi:tartrate/fumarate subfamily iron-sulfur-dependent hydro-lyase beta chain
MAVFHCGPVVKKEGDKWQVVSAGPTTSMRMEIFEDDFIKKFGTRMIIGKGGMGEKTLTALQESGAVYVHYTGGAGALAAKAIKGVENVYWLKELGIPEAAWIFEVKDFGPLSVTMDSHGESLYTSLDKKVKEKLKIIHKKINA